MADPTSSSRPETGNSLIAGTRMREEAGVCVTASSYIPMAASFGEAGAA